MNPKEILDVLLVPAGLCDPQSLRLVWVNPALARLLAEHSLEATVSVRTLTPAIMAPPNEGKDGKDVVRDEATLPASKNAEATSARCQLGPAIDVGGDRLLMFHMLPNTANDASRATLNIFSRHMNAREAAWETERQALMSQIEALLRK